MSEDGSSEDGDNGLPELGWSPDGLRGRQDSDVSDCLRGESCGAQLALVSYYCDALFPPHHPWLPLTSWMPPSHLLVFHGVLLGGAGCMFGHNLEKTFNAAFGPINNIFYHSTSLLVLSSALTAMFLSLLLAVVSAFRRSRRRGKPMRISLNPRFQISSYITVSLFTFLAITAFLETLKRASFTTTTLSLSLLPLPILLLTHFLSPSRVPLSTYAPTLPLLIGYALYLHSLPTPPTSFDREDRSIATGLLIAATILTPLLFHAVALDFPSQFDTRVVENWPWAGARGERWDPLDKRSSSLVDLAFFGSLLLAAWALFATYASLYFTAEVVPSLDLLLHNPVLASSFLNASSSGAVAALVLLSSVTVFGAWRTSGLVGLVGVISIGVNIMRMGDWSELVESGWAGVLLVGLGMGLVLWEKGVEEAGKEESDDEDDELGSEEDSSKWKEDEKKKVAEEEVAVRSGGWGRLTTRRYYLLVYVLPIVSLIVFTTPFPSFTTSTWDPQLHRFLSPDCTPHPPVRWNGTTRTILASNPRSGNTFVRELVEATTGLQTSTIDYCDLVLQNAFPGECDHSANFLSKTHYPSRLREDDHDFADNNHVDRVAHLVRNPLDAVYSWWHFAHVPRTRHNQLSHSARIILPKGQLLGATQDQRDDLVLRARVWTHHDDFWHESPLPRHIFRYEDLSDPATRVKTLAGLLSFVLPEGRRDLSDKDAKVACSVRGESTSLAYRSRKPKPYGSWKKWDPRAREEVLKVVRDGWCRHGYQPGALERFGTKGRKSVRTALRAGVVAGGRLGEREGGSDWSWGARKGVVMEPVPDWERMCQGLSTEENERRGAEGGGYGQVPP